VLSAHRCAASSSDAGQNAQQVRLAASEEKSIQLADCCVSLHSLSFVSGHQTHDPKGTTLVKDRACTDKLILLLYIAACVGSVIVITSAASMGGNPQKILNAVDYNGGECKSLRRSNDKFKFATWFLTLIFLVIFASLCQTFAVCPAP
jgi:hypothetical protein